MAAENLNVPGLVCPQAVRLSFSVASFLARQTRFILRYIRDVGDAFDVATSGALKPL